MFPPPSPDVQSWHPSVSHVPSTLNSGGAGFAHVDMRDLAWKRRGLFFSGLPVSASCLRRHSVRWKMKALRCIPRGKDIWRSQQQQVIVHDSMLLSRGILPHTTIRHAMSVVLQACVPRSVSAAYTETHEIHEIQ